MKFKLLFLASLLVLFITGCTDVATSSVNVTEGVVTMNPGETYGLDVNVNAEVGTYVQFQSKDPNVVTVDDTGLITAVGAGETLVTITAGIGTDYVLVRVLGDVTVAFDATDFMSSYDSGAYRIELRGDVTLTDVLEIDRPIEIVFNGYTLTGDLKVISDFEGGIALNNNLSVETLLSLVEDDLFVLDGTLDMGGFLIPVYSNYVSFYRPDTFDFIITNYYEVEGYDYNFNYEYEDIGDAIPIASIDDLQNISSSMPYVFAEGTPYERAVLNPSKHANYTLVNDIQGESTLIDTHIVVGDTNDGVYIFDDVETGLMDSYDNDFDIDFLLRYNRANMYVDSINLYTNDTLPTHIQNYLTDNAITMAYGYQLYEYEFEFVPEEDIDFENFVLDGRNYTIQNWQLDTNDELFDYASGQVELHNINFRYLMGSADDSSSEGMIFGIIDAQTVVFKNLVLENFYYEIESDDEDNYGMLVGDLDQADDFTMVNVFVFSNKMYAEYAGDIGFLFGEFNNTNGFVRNVTMSENVTFQDSSDDDFGLFAGFVDNSNVVVSGYHSINNKVYGDVDDSGVFVGTMDSTRLVFDDFTFENDYLEGEDNISAIVGDLYYSHVDISNGSMYGVTVTGLNNVAGLFGEVDHARLSINDVYVNNLTIEGTYKLSAVIGEINTNSNVDIQHTKVYYSSISGSEDQIGSMVGYVTQSYLMITNSLLSDSTINASEKTGGFIGFARRSVVDIMVSDVAFSTINADYSVGGFIGNNDETVTTISKSNFTDNTLTGISDIGGLIGFANGVLQFNLALSGGNSISGQVNVSSGIGSAVNVDADFNRVYVDDEIAPIQGETALINVGGIFGNLNESNVVITETFSAVSATNVVQNFGGIVGIMSFSSLEVNTYEGDIQLETNSDHPGFVDATFGNFVGNSITSMIEVYYESSSAIYNNTATVNQILILANAYSDYIGTYSHASGKVPIVDSI